MQKVVKSVCLVVPVWKNGISMELVNNIAKDTVVYRFSGVGERTREGNDLLRIEFLNRM